MADIKLPPEPGLPAMPASPAAQAMRAIANKIDRGEIRSVYVCIIRADGRPDDRLVLYPAAADRDLNVLGNHMINVCEKMAGALKLGVEMAK